MTRQERVRHRGTFAFLIVFSVGLFFECGTCAAQGGGFGGGGFSSSSFSSTRAGHLPPADSIFIEEFFNYHRHDIRLPKADETIAMELRWGCSVANETNREHFLQIGLATARDRMLDDARPINLCFVIDRSSSMSGNRIENVKKAMLASLDVLRETDTVSIVVFAEGARTVVEPRRVGDGLLLREAIQGIRVGGSTNLCAGLMKGLAYVEKNFDSDHNNRVILLTDGRTNQGECDSEAIITKAKPFLERGIDLASIGVGSDFNHSLMRQLAESGRGLVHFVENDADIEKVFVDELDGLLSSATTDVTLRLQFEDGLRVDHIYGYSPILGREEIRFDLDPLRAGTTQVVLLRCRVADIVGERIALRVRATLEYTDTNTERKGTLQQQAALRFDPFDGRRLNPLSDAGVRRNVSIALLADAIKSMAVMWEQGKYPGARVLIRERLRLVESMYPMAMDDEVDRVRDIAREYLRDAR